MALNVTRRLLPVTGELRDTPLLRLRIEPSPENGLREPSQMMVDKAHTLRREKIGASFGQINDGVMVAASRALALFLSLRDRDSLI